MKHFYLVFKRHILIPILIGDFFKPWHFLISILRFKFFNYPYSAMIEIGNTCNLQCPTCPTPRQKILRKKELMSFSNFILTIDSIKNSIHVVYLYYTGEPLIHPDICKMINYVHQKNLYSIISTNATLLDQKIADELLFSGLDEIILCLDGITQESFSSFRKKADFFEVMRNIGYFCKQKQRLKLKKPFIKLQVILNKLNQNEIRGIKKLSDCLKVDCLHIKSLALCEHVYSKDEIKKLADIFFPDGKEYKDKIRYKQENHKLIINNPPSKCSLAESQFVVLVDCKISMCCYDLNGNYIYGNILAEKFDDIWFNSDVKKVRELANEKKHSLCKVCSNFI